MSSKELAKKLKLVGDFGILFALLSAGPIFILVGGQLLPVAVAFTPHVILGLSLIAELEAEGREG